MCSFAETTHTPQGDGNTTRPSIRSNARRNNPHPARGRKPDRQHDVKAHGGNNPHPARGRKLGKPRHPASPPKKQPTPRKGTETQPFCLANVASEKQPTPRKGTETLYCSAPAAHSRGNNPHPARGRKPVEPVYVLLFLETTHTPQGDGNQKTNARSFAIMRNNPHPARGRKRPADKRNVVVQETTHTPQGDGNQDGGDNLALGRKQPTPRKGTETSTTT